MACHEDTSIAIYVSDSFNSKEISFNSDFLEQLWVKIELLNHFYLLIGTIYPVAYTVSKPMPTWP